MFAVEISHGTDLCDKCNKPVPVDNDVITLEVLLGTIAEPMAFIFQSRHILPTEDCPGSPSRAQYLKGQPLDARGDYPYRDEWEVRIRAAWDKMNPPETVVFTDH